MELGRFMGALHPALIHFPIALLLTAVLLEAVAFAWHIERLAWAARLLLLLGAVSVLFAFVCGNFAELWAARSGVSQEALEYHEFLATVTSWVFVGLTGWRLLMRETTPRAWRGLWLLAAVGACAGLVVTGLHGGKLVYEHAAAVQEVGPRGLPSHEDLQALLQRQDRESIFYSDMMHHIFGWLVLVLALLLLMDRAAPKVGEKARRVGPVLLLAGGLFLMVFSDQDAWPLYHVRPFRPITDKEVLLHKTYAVLMLGVGLHGLWTLRRKRRNRLDVPRPSGDPARHSPDRLMAVFALVGGALLFTHIHSAAPYANIAVGVYIHHTVMGFVALAIGAVKLLDDALARPSRWRAMAYPALMALEAVLLIRYNEGLPWFMGYPRFQGEAPAGRLAAPLGPHRAELSFDPATARLEMQVLRSGNARPVTLAAREARAIVQEGQETTEVRLAAEPPGTPRPGRFAGTAPFLRGAPLFQARISLPVDGRERTADFEPWVDRSQAGAGASAAWICPMHPHIGAARPGRCPLCGMALQSNRPRPPGVLHDPGYRMDLLLDPPAPMPGRPARLVFTPQRAVDGGILRELDVVHTKRLHLIVVSRDLAFFDHVHPEPQPDGTLTLVYAFPAPGEYLLYADVTPSGAAQQVFRLPVTVRGAPPPPVPLGESPAPARLFGDYRVRLAVSPIPPRPRDEAALTFTLEKEGRPVTDLQPYLGAAGHCVILSQDTRDFLHSHPLEPPGGPAVTGPAVSFHARFPRPGLYKVWAQFQHRGKVLTADFVIRVP